MSILQTGAVNLAVFGHCHPTLATFNHADWLVDPRSAKDDYGARQLQADAKAKRSGIAPPQIVGETEQAWSCGHDESAYCCIETDEETE